MPLTLDRTGGVAYWQQIVSQVTRLADEGAMAPGDRLPPSRTLAGMLGVNRSTVCRAYEELAALGYLESRPGSYSTIRRRPVPLARSAAARAGRSAIAWDRVASPAVRALCRPAACATGSRPPVAASCRPIDFASLAADPLLCPVDELRRAAGAVLRRHGTLVFDYGDAAGLAPLRELLARRLRAHGVAVCADEVLLTNGAQHALDLVLRLLAPPGSPVVVESPTYGQMLGLLRVHGARVIGIPMRGDGLDLDALDTRLRRVRPALLYTVPSCQNPTGITTSQAHRERLLALCAAHRVPIVEDGFEEEMKYFGRAVLPLKSMDARGLVVYVGTFSKVIAPGLRVGWVAADRRCIALLAALNHATMLASPAIGQAVLERFCHMGRYDAYLRRVHVTFRRRMTTLLAALDRRVPQGRLTWTRPAGGATLWACVPGGHRGDEARLVEAAAAEGVTIAPGSAFLPGTPDVLGFRLSIAEARTYEIDAGCRRLVRALDAVVPAGTGSQRRRPGKSAHAGTTSP